MYPYSIRVPNDLEPRPKAENSSSSADKALSAAARLAIMAYLNRLQTHRVSFETGVAVETLPKDPPFATEAPVITGDLNDRALDAIITEEHPTGADPRR